MLSAATLCIASGFLNPFDRDVFLSAPLLLKEWTRETLWFVPKAVFLFAFKATDQGIIFVLKVLVGVCAGVCPSVFQKLAGKGKGISAPVMQMYEVTYSIKDCRPPVRAPALLWDQIKCRAGGSHEIQTFKHTPFSSKIFDNTKMFASIEIVILISIMCKIQTVLPVTYMYAFALSTKKCTY